MGQYRQHEISDIFWASNDGFKRGRDPLGIQNSSVATYSTLLPGLTNLTRHIRYYSFYCWILSEFDKLDANGETDLHQYNFIRRAELTMALIMKDQDVKSVVGSLYVAQGRCKQIEDGRYNIADGADYESRDRYWSFKSGAFGQYYFGSLIYFGLVKVEENRFYLRDKGKELAEEFRSSVDDEVRDVFLECISDGNITEEVIGELQQIGLLRINVDSPEWVFLNGLLTKADKESAYRRETIYLLLKDLSNGVKIEEFIENRFLNVTLQISAAFGWYFYYLCESLHYCLDSFFCLILNKIHELNNPTMAVLSRSIIDTLVPVIEKGKKNISLEELRSNTIEDINILYDEVKKEINNQNYVSSVVSAIRLMVRLYTEYEENSTAIKEFEMANDLFRQRGIFSAGIKSYVKRNLDLSVAEFIGKLIMQIMEEHTIVAIAKMGTNNSDLRKFIFEDGRVVLVEQRYPVETSPRIQSLFNFLQDMGYIDEDNRLTQIAQQYLEAYGKE